MPLHLLGKKSWNVYNPDNIARVKADEAAAAAQEAAEEERMQEYDAARRAAILRGESPPPAPKEIPRQQEDRHRRSEGKDGYSQKRRRHGEDDTDRDIRLAASAAASKGDHAGDQRLLKLCGPANDAPLTDHAGHIDLFPVDHKEALKRERRSEADKEKKRKEQALEDQYKMRLSSAAGKDGLGQPWYAAADSEVQAVASAGASGYSGFESKDVWGNEDPLRQSRQQARLSAEDPLMVMKWGEEQTLQHEKEKKKWLKERNRELQALKAIQDGAGEEEQRHSRRRKRAEDDNDGHDRRPSKHHRRHRSRSPGRERREDNHRRDRERKDDHHRRDRERKKDHDRRNHERKEDHHRRERERKEDHRRRDRESDDHHRRDRSKREDHHRQDGMHPGTKRH